MKSLTKTTAQMLFTLLLTWGMAAFAQETDDATTNDSAAEETTESAYNWVEMPDQNPFPPPTITDGFGNAPQLIDFDGDGDLDAFDSIYYYENLGTLKEPKFKTPPTKITDQFFAGAEIKGHFRFADIDGDNDWDAFVTPAIQSGENHIKYYENTGQKNAPVYKERTGIANPLANVQMGDNDDIESGAILSFVDIDADQDLDIFFGYQSKRAIRAIQYYENTGNSNRPVFEKRTDSANPLNEIDIPRERDMPCFADLDQDGDLDVVITSSDKMFDFEMVYFENIGTAKQPQFEERSANPLNDIVQSNSWLTPIDLKDIDNDNDIDVFMGRASFLPLTYYENSGTIHSPQFVEDKTLFEEPNTVNVGVNLIPNFVDIDNDGDQDVFMSTTNQGTILYYENIGNARFPQFKRRTQTANPFHNVFLKGIRSLLFADIDSDGDWDVFVSDDEILYYENTGRASHPQFVKNPVNLLGDVTFFSPRVSVVDIDHDGDMDLFTAEPFGQPIRYFENTGNQHTPVFTEYSSKANPLDGITILYMGALYFEDMDQDGDPDALLFDADLFRYYENTGGPSFPVFEPRTGQNNPFFTLKLEESAVMGKMELVDLDNDGPLEVFIGLQDGTVKYYQNVSQHSTSHQPLFKKSLDNPLAPISAKNNGVVYSVSFADLDNDDDWDVFAISALANTKIRFYENIGDSHHPHFIGESTDNVVQKLNAAYKISSVVLVDLDQNEHLEVLMATYFNKTLYYENVGDALRPHFEELGTNPFKEIDANPSDFHFVDIDNDQDLDFFVGQRQGGIRYFENTGHSHRPSFEERVESANPLSQVALGITPRLIDIDQDNDSDAFIVTDSQIRYFENTGDVNQAQFEERTGPANPLAEIQLEEPVPAFVDIDQDGDLDVFIGHKDGSLNYYENTGTMTTPQFVERVNHPLSWARNNVGGGSKPHFADFDQDGDWDIFISHNGPLLYVENTGNATQPLFQQPRSNNPLSKTNLAGVLGIHFVDIDNDKDQDIFRGEIYGDGEDIKYYENIGDGNSPKFVERTDTFTTLEGKRPIFVDIDNDQDWDAFIIPKASDSIRYYENVGQVSKAQFVERLDTANPLALVTTRPKNIHFVDGDSDQDWDVVIFLNNKIGYYENIGQPDKPKFIENNTANPFKNLELPNNAFDFNLIDMDKDGDLDAFFTFIQNSAYYVNTSAKGPTLADHYALPKGGKYAKGREINLGCFDCSQIYYTLDGSQPSIDSPVFTAPFQVTETTTLKFLSVDAQGNASFVTTEQYLIDTQPPVLTFTWPINNQVLLNISQIEGTAFAPDGGSKLDRIELQVHNGPLYLSDDNDDPFTKSPVWIKFPITSSSELWFYDFERLQLPVGPYTITARAYDFAGNYAEETLTVVKVEQAISDLFLELSSATLLNDATLNAKGSLVSRRFPSVPENLAGLPIELTITAPDGSTRTKTTQLLSDIGQYEFNELSDFTLEGAYTLQTRFAGNQLLTESVSAPQTVLIGESAGYAIIIQGQIENGEGLDSHNKTTNRIYQVLKERGFEDANIFYFNPNLDQQEIEIDGPPTVADFVTIEEMQNRINGSPAPFYLIMVDHGDRGGNFYINDVDLEYVTPEIWAWWLDELEAGLKDLSKPRIIMLGYCYSGKTLAAISKPGRIVISSATAKEESYKGPREPDGIRGGEYFMDELFNALGRGGSFRDAFNKAAEKTNEYTDRGGNRFINIVNDFGDESVQHPLIDIDGDGQGSHDAKLEQNTETNPSAPNSPYNLADMYLGAGADYDTNYAGNPADILSVADTIYLSPEQTAANLSMTVNHQVHRIKEAAVNVRLPSTELKPADTEHTGYAEQREIVELVEINLLCDFSQRCERNTDEVTPDLFTEPGKYNLYYFVVDNETDNMSPVHRSVVYKTKANNGAPSRFELLAPEDMATTETALTFDWQTSIEPEDEPITYTLVIAEDADFHNMVYQKSDIRASEQALEPSTVLLDGSEGLQPGTSYYWTVEAVDFFGARTTASEWRIFRIESE